MKDMLSFFRELRCSYPLLALIGAEELMGFPAGLDGMWYLPFFWKRGEGRYALSAGVWLESPSGRLIRFERARKDALPGMTEEASGESPLAITEAEMAEARKRVSGCLREGRTPDLAALSEMLPERLFRIYEREAGGRGNPAHTAHGEGL